MNTVDDLLLKWANGGLTSSEKEELANHYNTADLDQFMIDSGKFELETSNLKIEWSKLRPQLQNNKSKNHSKVLLWLIPVFLVLAVSFWYFNSIGPDKTIKNSTYEPLLIAMEDDSEILLSPGSTISYNESRFANNRKIWLEGRAYFDVRVKGDFSVLTNNSIVSVMGTTFDIWEIDEDNLVVQCFTGKVNVSTSKGMGGDLTAGQKFSDIEGSLNVGNIENENKPKWLVNTIVFEGLPLSIVYKDLEKYYPIKFVGEISSLNFNGELPTNDLQKVTEILNAVTSDTYKIENDRVVVSKSE